MLGSAIKKFDFGGKVLVFEHSLQSE
jgi:hypothetical protein